MMRFSAETLDLSRFPAPLALRDIDFQTDLDERMAALVEAFTEAGIPFDVEQLMANPGAILERVDNYRELLVKGSINDAVRATMVAFAVGSDLDHLAALYGVARLTLVAATNAAPAVLESDAQFRRRVLLAAEAFGGGPAGAYLFHALTADPRVMNADVWTPEPGVVHIAVQARDGMGAAPLAVVEAVRDYVGDYRRKMLTDVLVVQSVVEIAYAIDVEVFILRGPDPVMVKAAVEEGLLAMTVDRRTPARDIPRSAVFDAAHVASGVIDKVLVTAPAADIARGYGEVGVCTGINVTVTVYDG